MASLDPPNWTPCWYCKHYGYFSKSSGLVRCAHPVYPMNCSQPERGCCSWERMPGVDDDGWQPVGFVSQQEAQAALWASTHRRDADGAQGA